MNTSGMIKVYEKKYVHEREKNTVLSQRYNETQDMVHKLRKELNDLRARPAKGEGQDQDDDRFQSANRRAPNENINTSNSDNQKWKNAYEKLEETCRLLKKRLQYPENFEIADVVLEEGMRTEMQRLREAIKRTAEMAKIAEDREKNKVMVLQRQYAHEKKRAETYLKAARKADVDGDVLTLQRDNEGFRATAARLGMKVNRLEKKLRDAEATIERQQSQRVEGKTAPEPAAVQKNGWVGDGYEPEAPKAIRSKKDHDADAMIATLTKRVRKLHKRNLKLSDALTMQKVLAEAEKSYGKGAGRRTKAGSIPNEPNSSPTRGSAAGAAAAVRARGEARAKARIKAQEAELVALRRTVAELQSEAQKMTSRAMTSTQILAARDHQSTSSKRKGAKPTNLFARPKESLEEELNVLRANLVEAEGELDTVRTALITEQRRSQKRDQDMVYLKSMVKGRADKSGGSAGSPRSPILYNPAGNDGIPWGEIEHTVGNATKGSEERKTALAYVQQQRRIERMYTILREKQGEIHRLKVTASKSAPAAQATERALEEYFNEVVRLRDQVAGMKGSFLKTTGKLRKRLRASSKKLAKVREDSDATLKRILEVYPEAIAIVTGGKGTTKWLEGKVRTKKKRAKRGKTAEEGTAEDILEWGPTQVTAWLATDADLLQHVEAFASEAIDGHLLLTLTDDDLKEDLGISSSEEREKVMKAIVDLRSQSGNYKRFYGTGGMGDVGKVEIAKPPSETEGGSAAAAAAAADQDQGPMWSPLAEAAVSPRDKMFDRELMEAAAAGERSQMMKREISRLRASKREMLRQQEQMRVHFEQEREQMLREQEDALRAVHEYAQQQMYHEQQQAYHQEEMEPAMSQEEQEAEWRKEQRRQEIEALKNSLIHVDAVGKKLPDHEIPKPKKLPCQMNDGVAPPMEHHSPDLKKRPAKSAMKRRGNPGKEKKFRVKYAGAKESNVAIIPRIDDEQIDDLFWSQEDQERATQEVERFEMQQELLALKNSSLQSFASQQQNFEIPTVGGYHDLGGSGGPNNLWNMAGVTFADDDPYYDDEYADEAPAEQEEEGGDGIGIGIARQEGGIGRSVGFTSLPKEGEGKSLEEEEDDDDDAEYANDNFVISGSDEEEIEDDIEDNGDDKF